VELGKRKTVTISDVAKEAGVSLMTVSRALSQPERVSAKTIEKINLVIDRLGFVPNPNARALAAGRTNVIAVLVPSISNHVFVEVLRGIYDVADSSNFQVQFANTRYSPDEEERLVRTFLSQKPAGMIVSGINQSEATAAILRGANCRIVQIMDLGNDPIDMMIGFSHYEAAKAATLHLIANGFSRPGLLAARLDPRTEKRIAAFKDTTLEAGLFDENRIITSPRTTSIGIGSMLARELLDKAPDTDAVLCINDDLALGALFECQRRGVKVPEQIAICGFNDMEFSALAHPALTSVRTYREKMGAVAMQMLLSAIEGQEPENPVVDLGFEVIERESTRIAEQPGKA
jgi:LacI family gluconate utilization system Gnt-I transcriptional repressor